MDMYAKVEVHGVDIYESEQFGVTLVDRRMLAHVIKSTQCRGVYFYANRGPPINILKFITEFNPSHFALSIRRVDLDFVVLNAKDFAGLTNLDVKDAATVDKRIVATFPRLSILNVRGVSLSLLLLELPEMARRLRNLDWVQFRGSDLDVAHLVNFLDYNPGFCDRAWTFEADRGKSDDVIRGLLARRGIDYRTADAHGLAPFYEFRKTPFSDLAKAEGKRRSAMLVMMASPSARVSPCCRFMWRDGDRRIRKLVSQFLI
jgi:hypothetical protein